MTLIRLLAQASGPASRAAGSATRAITTVAAGAGDQGGAAGGTTYHVAWEKWLTFYNWDLAIRGITALLLMMLLGVVLLRMFKGPLQKHHLRRATVWALVAMTVYVTVIAAHPWLMLDKYDVLALVIHKVFVAILVLVAMRYLDQLIILPLLTRISKTTPSRFVHQIIMAVIFIFAIAGYCSWAFGFELGSLLAGSAVISIVLGLALQETLGNFFSGMVLQASLPFQTGDWIQVGEMEGRVVEMTWRAVTLLTNANNYVLIPNSTVAKEKIVNYHTPSTSTASTITVGLEYRVAPNDAKRVLLQAAAETKGVLADPAPHVNLLSFDDSAITYKVYFWFNQPQGHLLIEEAVRVNSWYRLNQAGMNIPFPIRTVEMVDLDKKNAAAEAQGLAARLATIGRSPLFSELAPEVQQRVAARSREFALAAGQAFFRQDDPGDSLFLLVAGTVGTTVRTGGAPGREIDGGDLTAPALLGEVSAVTGQPRGATVRAKTDVRAIEIDHEQLQDLFTREPALMDHFSRIVAQRQAQRNEALQKLGAGEPYAGQQGQSESVLDRMKRLFARRSR